MRMRSLLATLAIVAGACTGDTHLPGPTQPRTVPPGGVDPEPAAADPADGAVEPPAPIQLRAVHGVGHTAAIAVVTVSSDGRAALTRDSFGSVRFWPALDGTAEPMIVPLPGARHMSLSHGDAGWLLAMVDSAEAGHLYRVDPDGSLRELH